MRGDFAHRTMLRSRAYSPDRAQRNTGTAEYGNSRPRIALRSMQATLRTAGFSPASSKECGRDARAPKVVMLYTSLIVELLRSQPRLAFWTATLAQGAL